MSHAKVFRSGPATGEAEMRITGLGVLAIIAVIATVAVAFVIWQKAQQDDQDGSARPNGTV